MAGLSLATGAARAPLKVRANDLYETPVPAVSALLAVEPLPHRIWEPACGCGAIVGVLRRACRHVIATDLVGWGCPDSTARLDFLMTRRAPPGVEAICTNPPFKNADDFVRHALTLNVAKVVMLLRLAFLESERRADILDGGQLARVHLFRKRLPFMHRHGYDGPKNSSSAMPFAWFVWEHDYDGPITLNRIDWPAVDGEIVVDLRTGPDERRYARIKAGGKAETPDGLPLFAPREAAE